VLQKGGGNLGVFDFPPAHYKETRHFFH